MGSLFSWKKKNEEVKGNQETHFLLRKHCIGKGKNNILRLMIVLLYLIWNIVSYVIQKRKGAGDYYEHISVFYSKISHSVNNIFDDQQFGAFCNNSPTCGELNDYFVTNYQPIIYPLMKDKMSFMSYGSLKQMFILIDQVMSIGMAFVYGFLLGTDPAQIYVSLASLLTSGNMNAEELSYQMVKYSKRFSERIKNICFAFTGIWKILIPVILLISFLINALNFTSTCLNGNNEVASKSDQLIHYIQNVLTALKISQEDLFKSDFISDVKWLQKDLNACSGGDFMSYLWSEPFSAISFIVMLYALIDNLKRIYHLTCGKHTYVSHYCREEIDSEFLIPVPNEGADKQIRVTTTEEKDLDYHQQMKKMKKEEQKEEKRESQIKGSGINPDPRNGNKQQSVVMTTQPLYQTQQNLQYLQPQPINQSMPPLIMNMAPIQEQLQMQMQINMQQQMMLQMQMQQTQQQMALNNPQLVPLQYQYNNPNYQYGYQQPQQMSINPIQYQIGNQQNIIF